MKCVCVYVADLNLFNTDIGLWAMRSMLLDVRSCTRYAIGARIILGIGALLLRIAGGSRGMCMIIGIHMMRDVLGEISDFLFWQLSFLKR